MKTVSPAESASDGAGSLTRHLAMNSYGVTGVLSIYVAPVAEPYDQDAHRVILDVANYAIVPDPITP